MGRPERCGGCDDAGKNCANCGMCVACAVESLNEGEGYCTICIGDVLAHVQSQIARLEEERDEVRDLALELYRKNIHNTDHYLQKHPWLEDE